MTTMKQWEKKVLTSPGAPERVAQIEEELRLAASLTRLREQAGLSRGNKVLNSMPSPARVDSSAA